MFLTSCSPLFSNSAQPQVDSAANLQQFLVALRNVTLVDLDAANVRALSAPKPDVIASNCFVAIRPYIAGDKQLLPGANLPFAGAIDAFEAGRLGGQSLQGSLIPDDLRLGCAPLVQDERDLVLRLTALFSGRAMIAGGIAGALGPK
jgi:hypothetical protein